jgi:drug/metabolite transporter (DMT)-like permease
VQAAPAGALIGAAYLGVVPTAVGFSTWAYALSRLPAAQLGVTTYVIPAIVVLLGFAAFREIPAPLAIAGGVVCLAGVALSRKKSG